MTLQPVPGTAGIVGFGPALDETDEAAGAEETGVLAAGGVGTSGIEEEVMEEVGAGSSMVGLLVKVLTEKLAPGVTDVELTTLLTVDRVVGITIDESAGEETAGVPAGVELIGAADDAALEAAEEDAGSGTVVPEAERHAKDIFVVVVPVEPHPAGAARDHAMST